MKKVLFCIVILLLIAGLTIPVSACLLNTGGDELNYFLIYKNNLAIDAPPVQTITNALYAEGAIIGTSIDKLDILDRDLDSGYFYPWLNSSIQADLDGGSITLRNNQDYGWPEGYTWYYNNPLDAYVLSDYFDQNGNHITTRLFGATWATSVPIPSSFLLLASGIAGLLVYRRKRAYVHRAFL